jgi:hypothetical protein
MGEWHYWDYFYGRDGDALRGLMTNASPMIPEVLTVAEIGWRGDPIAQARAKMR